MTAVHANVAPKSLPGNVMLSICPVRFLLGVSVKTGLVSVKPFTPAPSVALIVTLAYTMVLLSRLSTPNLYVWTPLVLASESRCTKTIWLKLGAAAVGPDGVTVTVIVVVWTRLPLVPVTLTK